MKKALLIMTAILCATPAFADDDAAAREKDQKFFTFGNSSTRDRNPSDCQSPKKPDFISLLSFREQRLLQSVYLNEAAKPILNTKTCSCDKLYPSYDHAVEVYNRDFVPLGLPAVPGSKNQEIIVKYIEDASRNYNEAVNICISLGVS